MGSEFPFDALPGPLADLAKAASAAGGYPPEFVAVPGLSVLAAAVGGRAALGLNPFWVAKPILWTAVCAGSSSGKTPAMAVALAPLQKLEGLWAEGYAARMTDHSAALAALLKGDEQPPDPVRRRCCVGDITIEKLAPILLDNPMGGVLWARPELSAILSSWDQYHSGGKGAGRSSALELWDGQGLPVDRIGRGSIYVPAPRVSITAGLVPDKFASLLGGSDGLAPRFLVGYYPAAGRPRTNIHARIDHGVIDTWDRLVRAMVGVAWDPTPPLPGEPQVLSLDATAEKLWKAADARYGAWFDDARTSRYGHTVIGKAMAHLANLALILHVAGSPDPIPQRVSGATMARAAAIIDYFVGGTLEVDDPEPSAAADRATRQLDEGVATLASWLRRRQSQEATAREVLRAHVAGCRTGDEVARLVGRYGATYPGCVAEGHQAGVSRGRAAQLVRAPERRREIVASVASHMSDASAAPKIRPASNESEMEGKSEITWGHAPVATVATLATESEGEMLRPGGPALSDFVPLPDAALASGPDLDEGYQP